MINYSEFNLISHYFKDQKNGLLIDVGAHEGGVTTEFVKKDWKVIAFEPEENNRKEFLIKHASNKNVICIPKAVTDNSGDKIPFYTSHKHYGIHSIKPFHNTHHSAEYNIETITLKDTLEENQIDHVSFLKIDIEGADFLALKGFDWDRIKPELVMVEFMDNRSIKNFNYSHHDMVHFMAKFGYACFVSEWGPIKEYGIKGQPGESHEWLGCELYPLNHDPSWGNLIFIPLKNTKKFKRTLKNYLRSAQEPEKSLILRLKIFIKKTFFS